MVIQVMKSVRFSNKDVANVIGTPIKHVADTNPDHFLPFLHREEIAVVLEKLLFAVERSFFQKIRAYVLTCDEERALTTFQIAEFFIAREVKGIFSDFKGKIVFPVEVPEIFCECVFHLTSLLRESLRRFHHALKM